MDTYSKHASNRSRQRCIPATIIDWIINYGVEKRSNGANTFFMNKKTRKAFKKDIGSIVYNRIKDLLDAYVVVADDGTIITAAWRQKHFKV